MTIECPRCLHENPDETAFCGKCGTKFDAEIDHTKTIKSQRTDKLIADKYQILEELGRGGMGIVYKVKDTKLKRNVALKFLPAELMQDKQAKARFFQEAQAAAALNHPNICIIHEVDEADDQTFIAMEFIKGQTLKDRIAAGKLETDEAVKIVTQIGEGLNEAHDKGIIHRDIKPANIMLTDKGTAKIMDFGIAKLAGGVDLTKPSTLIGTIAYMSPEQARGENVDHRTDIWSLGVMFYEMLTGSLPFQGDHETAIMHSIIYEEPQNVKKMCPDCPDVLVDVIATCLQKEAEKRFASMRKILDILEEKAQPSRVSVLSRKHNLPVELTSFIGRSKEIKTVQQLLSENRLVTLTGAGGCGKSRLAIQIANSSLPIYPDGVWIVELAPLAVPEHIDQAVAGIFNIREQPGTTLIQIITNYLRCKQLLLVLDNCEHLIAACSDIVEQILKSTTDVTILTTSREALNVADEVTWRVPSLSLPQDGKELSAEELGSCEAIQLFIARARNKQPDFQLSDQNSQTVLQICIRLDGIPLAIELAASRLNVFNPELILSRLDDRFRLLTGGSRTALERHKTLQATIDWSYGLLSENEKTIFNQLSVFVGGFDLESYEQICGSSALKNLNSIDVLTGLIEKSLVITLTLENGEFRYQLLETIRHYAKKKLFESGETDTIRESHYQYYSLISEQAYSENLEKAEYWLSKLEIEHDNIIAALEWVRSDSDKLLRLAGVLGWFWYDHSHYKLGLEYLKDLDISPKDADLTMVRAMASYGWLLAVLGDPKGIAIIENSLELWNKFGNTRDKAQFLFHFAFAKSLIAEYAAAQKAASEINTIARELDDNYLLLRSRTAQTFIHVCQLQVDSAEPLAEQNLKDAITLKDNHIKAWNAHFFSDCALMRNDYNETERRYSIAINYWLETGNIIEVLAEMGGVAFALSGQGRYIKALRLQGAIDAKYEEFGASMVPVKFWMDWIEEYIGGARKAVGEKAAAKYEQEGRQMGFEKAVEYALDFDKD